MPSTSEGVTLKSHRDRVLFIGHDGTRTGAPNSLLKIVDWIANNTAYEPLVVLGRGGPLVNQYAATCDTYVWEPDEGLLLSGPTPSRLSKGLARMRFSKLAARLNRRAIVSVVRRASPVCIFSNTGVTGDLLRYLSVHCRAPVVSRIPELEGYMRRNMRAGGLRTVLSRSDHFIAVSNAVRRNLEQRHAIPADRISVVYGACDADTDYPRTGDLKAKLGFDSRDQIVCGCGTLDWRKGFDLFLQTAYQVCCIEGRKDIRFVWAGDPISVATGIEYAYEIEMMGLSSSLTLLGSHENPSELFAQCDIFFLSSREDPFPLVMLEAARQGLPILCFENSGGATEFVQSEFGTVLPALDVVAACREIVRRADHGAELVGVRDAARSRALQFSSERMGVEVASIIRNVVSGVKV